MIHAKQWHYSLHRDFQQLHSIQSTRRNLRDSSSTNSTFRRQRALRVILHARRQGDLLSSLQRPTRHSRHSSSTRTFQSFMTFQPSRHYYTFQHLPVQIQYLPVLSSASRDFHPFQHFFKQIGFHQKLH